MYHQIEGGTWPPCLGSYMKNEQKHKKTCIKNKSHDVEIRLASQTKILF
jgi:hypothetical protein